MNNCPNFKDKVALVTGASSGMGLATAQAFAEAGASVTLADVKEEAVREAVEKLVSEGHRAIAIPCDVGNDAQVEAMVKRTVAEFGRLDAAFNNAGVMAKIAPTADGTLEEFDRVIGVNLRGVWSCMKHELRQMERQGSGAIVNCSSIGGLGRPADSILYRVEARGHRPNADRGPRIRHQRHSRECGLSGHDRHGVFADGGRLGRQEIRGVVKSPAHRPSGQARGDRVGGGLAVQPGSELRDRTRPGRGRWSGGG